MQLMFKDLKHTYLIDIKGPSSYTKSLKAVAGAKQVLDNLAIGKYTISITIEGQKEYVQLFDVQVKQPDVLAVQAILSPDNQTLKLDLQGSDAYFIKVNAQTFEVKAGTWSTDLATGKNEVRVWTSQGCQGEFSREIFRSEEIRCFPNPTMGPVTVYVAGQDAEVAINIYDLQGKMYNQAKHIVDSMRMVSLDLSSYTSGTYLMEVSGRTVQQQVKLIKL
jgi:hypothetical protein